jgi:hypothetical protein
MITQLKYSVVSRSRGRVTSCVICTAHVEKMSTGFLIEHPNQGRRFVSGFPSKSLGRFCSVCPQN